jgi:hypothetical protein
MSLPFIAELDRGQILVVASAAARHPVVNLLTVGGERRIQGVCVIFDVGGRRHRRELDGQQESPVMQEARCCKSRRAHADQGRQATLVRPAAAQSRGSPPGFAQEFIVL